MKTNIINLLLFSGILIFIFNFKVVEVNGDSMQPTYYNYDLIICNKHRRVNKNDIVVFNHEGIKIKRILATNGDMVELKDKSVFVNNAQITLYQSENSKKYELTQGEYFVVGDNYLNSYDSRDFGVVKSEDIICSVKDN